jgi:hypothetical protein
VGPDQGGEEVAETNGQVYCSSKRLENARVLKFLEDLPRRSSGSPEHLESDLRGPQRKMAFHRRSR